MNNQPKHRKARGRQRETVKEIDITFSWNLINESKANTIRIWTKVGLMQL